MHGGRRRTYLMTDDLGLDGRQTRAARERAVRPLAGEPAATEGWSTDES